MKIFLGGTCPSNKTDFDYRTLLIPLLRENNIDYFNPVVEDWTDECQEIEEQQKEICDIHLYIVTPNMKGVYSIAETFGSLIKGYRSIFCYVYKVNDLTFDKSQWKSLEATGNLFAECGGESWVLDSDHDFDDRFIKEIILKDYYK